MSASAKFVGVIPYSLYEEEPVALIWRHNYTSLETRADSGLYSELVIKKIEEEETSAQAVARILSKVSNGRFIKTKKNKDKNNDIKQCYNKMLSCINKFKNVAILENNKGYKLYLIPVKFIKTKKLHNMIKNNVYYKECHWISFNKLLSVIYEINIQKMIVQNIENCKLKKNKKLTDYKACKLSLQFGSVLRNSHFRVLVPLFEELKFNLNKNVCTPEIQQMKTIAVEDEADEIDESFIVRCKKCRVKLFNDLLISIHSKNTLNNECKQNCIFLDSNSNKVIQLLDKMANASANSSPIKGLLTCFKCGQKIGRFNYCGQECPCTAYICPAFQICSSKVDMHQTQHIVKKKESNPDGLDIHLPETQFIEQNYNKLLNEEKKEKNIHIVHISDTHELYKEFTDTIPYKKDAINILIHSGDFSPEESGPIKRKRQGTDGIISKIKEFAKWFGELPHENKIIICGNHEQALVHLTKQQIQNDIFNTNGVIYLQDDMINLYGINIYGTPYNEREFMAFGANNNAMKKKWELIPNNTDILVTHQPPYNDDILCKVTSGGNVDLWQQVIHRIKPKVHLFGHFHGYNGYVSCNNVLFINSSLKPPTEREIPCIPHQFDVIFDL